VGLPPVEKSETIDQYNKFYLIVNKNDASLFRSVMIELKKELAFLQNIAEISAKQGQII